jgi:hypothetical protein
MLSIKMGYWKLPGQYNKLTRDNIANYNMKRGKKIIESVQLNPNAYRADLLGRFESINGKNKRPRRVPDFFYSYSDLNSNLRSKGVVGVLEDHVPDSKFYKNQISNNEYRKSILTSKGKLFALPYYGAHSAFIYNESHIQKAGFSEPPKDWEELTEQALRIKKLGISKTPIVVPLHGDGSVETLYALILGMNPKSTSYLFDKDSHPKFDAEGSPLYVVLKWLIHGIYQERIVSRRSVSLDVLPAAQQMKKGHFSFVWLPWYLLSYINYPDGRIKSPIKEGMNPGYGYTTCYTRTYAVAFKALRNKKLLPELWQVLEYFGGKTDEGFRPNRNQGKYRVAYRLALELGIPSPLDELWKDEKYCQALDRWGDIKVYKQQDAQVFNSLNDPNSPPWLAEWDGEWGHAPLRNIVHRILLKNMGSSELLSNLRSLARSWEALRAKYPDWEMEQFT